jgi:hypothetical protein
MMIKIIVIKMNCSQSSNNFLLDSESSALILIEWVGILPVPDTATKTK